MGVIFFEFELTAITYCGVELHAGIPAEHNGTTEENLVREMEKELGLRVIISTAVALGTRCQIEIEREIAMIESDLASVGGPDGKIAHDAFSKRVANIRNSMERLEESIVEFTLDLRKQVAKATPTTKSRPRPSGKKNRSTVQ